MFLTFVDFGSMSFLLLLMVGIPLVLFIYALVDIIRGQFQNPTNQVIWILVVLLAPVLGPLLYLILRDRFKAPPRQFNPDFKH